MLLLLVQTLMVTEARTRDYTSDQGIPLSHDPWSLGAEELRALPPPSWQRDLPGELNSKSKPSELMNDEGKKATQRGDFYCCCFGHFWLPLDADDDGNFIQ